MARGPRGSVAPVAEEREAFVIRVVLSDAPGESRVAAYVVPKRTWDLWWETAKKDLQGEVGRRGGFGRGFFAPCGAARPGCTEIPGSATDAVPDALTAEALPCADDTWDNGILDDVPDPRVVPHRGLDGKRDGGLGRHRRRTVRQHRQAVRPGHGHLDGDLDRGGALRALRPHRGLDGEP